MQTRASPLTGDEAAKSERRLEDAGRHGAVPRKEPCSSAVLSHVTAKPGFPAACCVSPQRAERQGSGRTGSLRGAEASSRAGPQGAGRLRLTLPCLPGFLKRAPCLGAPRALAPGDPQRAGCDTPTLPSHHACSPEAPAGNAGLTEGEDRPLPGRPPTPSISP